MSRWADDELPRLLDQLRQAATHAAAGTWLMALIDSRRTIRSAVVGLGPVVVFPPGDRIRKMPWPDGGASLRGGRSGSRRSGG